MFSYFVSHALLNKSFQPRQLLFNLLITGSFAITSLMVGTAVDASDCESLYPPSSSSLGTDNFVDDTSTYDPITTASPDDGEREEAILLCKVGVATALTLMTGLIMVCIQFSYIHDS